MPGTFVFTEPVTERYSDGADIFGSKVSTWVGPPPSHSQTTDVFRVPPVLAARARSRSGSRTPVAPRAPIFRKSRREPPSQAGVRRDVTSLSMGVVLEWDAVREWGQRKAGIAGQRRLESSISPRRGHVKRNPIRDVMPPKR